MGGVVDKVATKIENVGLGKKRTHVSAIRIKWFVPVTEGDRTKISEKVCMYDPSGRLSRHTRFNHFNADDFGLGNTYKKGSIVEFTLPSTKWSPHDSLGRFLRNPFDLKKGQTTEVAKFDPELRPEYQMVYDLYKLDKTPGKMRARVVSQTWNAIVLEPLTAGGLVSKHLQYINRFQLDGKSLLEKY